jgi:hypothetical protein
MRNNYRTLLLVMLPAMLIAVTLYWFVEYPKYSWKEMWLNCWNAE